MELASRGSLDEISSASLYNVLFDDLIVDRIAPPHATDEILRTSWVNILEPSNQSILHNSVSQEISMASSQSSKKVLGRRGRLYDDIWNEENFLEKHRGLPLKHCTDWSQLLKNYHDDHDGCYIDWLLEKLHHRKIVPTFLPPVRKRPHSQGGGGGGAVIEKEKKEKHGNENKSFQQASFVHSVLSMIPPPVPVSTQHPASWGPGNRISHPPLVQKIDRAELTISPTIHHLNPTPEFNIRDKLRTRPPPAVASGTPKVSSPRPLKVNQPKSRKISSPAELLGTHMIDVARIHPACVSKTILLPPGSKGAESTRPGRESVEEEAECSYDCVDEIGIRAEIVVELLHSVSARNYAYISRLLSSIDRETELTQMRLTRDRLLGSCQIIYNTMTESRETNLRNSLMKARQGNLPPPLSASTPLTMLPHLDSSNSFSSSSSSPLPSSLRNNHSNQRLFLARATYANSLGSLTSAHINNSNFVQSLGIGTKVEVRMMSLEGVWSACAVTGLKYDEAGVLRFIEVGSHSHPLFGLSSPEMMF
jgi:hypothetical protein